MAFTAQTIDETPRKGKEAADSKGSAGVCLARRTRSFVGVNECADNHAFTAIAGGFRLARPFLVCFSRKTS